MPVDAQALRQMIAQDSAATLQLKELLIRERTQLETRKQDELPLIIDQKTQLLDQLNEHTKIRHQLLTSAGLSCDAKGWDSFLQQDVYTRPLREQWRQLVVEFEKCQKMNEINGKMIARSQQTLTHLVSLVRGKIAVPSLYTARGTQTQQGSSYTVAKA